MLTRFARVEKDKVLEYPIIDIRRKLPNVSLPVEITDKDLPKGYVSVKTNSSFPSVAHDEKLVESTPVKVDGVWTQVWTTAKRDSEEVASLRQSAEHAVRAQRDELLSKTDWTQGKDIPNQVSMKWAAYRKQLRDVTDQEGFPFSIQWPEKPEA